MNNIVWTNGCFDVLHRGHIELFKFCKTLGNHLVVGIDTDKRVKQLKGAERPFNNEDDRREMLMAIRYIDEVVLFGTEEKLCEFIITLQPRMVVGSDYRDKRVVGSEFARDLTFFDRVGQYSTTNILK